VLLDTHIFEFAGLENLAALQTFHVLGILVAAYDLDPGMFARLSLTDMWTVIGTRRGWLGSHNCGNSISAKGGGIGFTGISRYFRPA
jgi:hypothetical protein